jgi:hypothetical protein
MAESCLPPNYLDDTTATANALPFLSERHPSAKAVRIARSTITGVTGALRWCIQLSGLATSSVATKVEPEDSSLTMATVIELSASA